MVEFRDDLNKVRFSGVKGCVGVHLRENERRIVAGSRHLVKRQKIF